MFNQGDFSEDDTDLVTDMFLRNPQEVLAKNFQTDISTFKNIPQGQKYIFGGTPSNGSVADTLNTLTTKGPNAGVIPRDQYYSYHLSQQDALSVPGGSVKIADPTVFPIAANFAMALFEIEPGAMREIHRTSSASEFRA